MRSINSTTNYTDVPTYGLLYNSFRNVAGHKEHHLHYLPKKHNRAKAVAASKYLGTGTQVPKSLLSMWF